LAARIAVIDHGKKIAEGTSRQLKAATGSGFLHVTLADPARLPEAEQILEKLLESAAKRSVEGALLSIRAATAEQANAAISCLLQAHIELTDFTMGQPSLDEVFFALTSELKDTDTKRSAHHE